MATATARKRTARRNGRAVPAPPPNAGAAIRVVAPDAIPFEALFWPWELIDWSAVRATLAEGSGVHIADVSENERKHWIDCAHRELGRLNVYAEFCHLRFDDRPTYGLWLIPRSQVSGVLVEGFDCVEE